jgi:hypothetical protein
LEQILGHRADRVILVTPDREGARGLKEVILLPDQEYVLPLTPDQILAISELAALISDDMARVAHDMVCGEDHGQGDRLDGFQMTTLVGAAVRGLSIIGPHLVAKAIFDGSIPSEVADEFFPGEFVVLPDGPAFLPG